MKLVKNSSVCPWWPTSTRWTRRNFWSEVTHDLKLFKVGCDVIVVNRWSNEFAGVADKVQAKNMLSAARGGANLRWVGLYFRYTPSFVVLAKYNYGYR